MKNKNFRFSNTGNAFLCAFAAYYAVSIIYQLVFTVIYKSTSAWPPVVVWCEYILNPVAFVSTVLIYSKCKNVDVVSATKLDKKLNLRQVGILALLSVCCIMAFLPISNIFLDLLSRMGFSMELNFADTNASAGAYFLGLLTMALLPAFSEEFLMRGMVLNAAEQKRDFSYAILITAGMFSLMHGNPIQTVHQFFLGAVLAYVVLVSRSLWAGVLLHFFNNFLSLSLDYPVSKFFEITGMYDMHPALWYLIWIVAILLGCTLVVYLLRKFTSVSVPAKPALSETNEIVDVYENKDGVFTTDAPLGKKVEKQRGDFVNAFKAITGLFKKNGFKKAYKKINDIIGEIVPRDDEVREMTREDFFPSNIKLVFIILGIIWVLSLISGFLL